MKKRSKKKKKGKGKILFFMILVGIILAILVLFHGEIFNALKSVAKRRSIPEAKRQVLLYFSDDEGEFLIGEKRKISKKTQVMEEVKEVINELIKGPRGKLIPTLPPRTRLLNLELGENGIAKVNFNHALSKDHPGGSSAEIMTVYSMVNTLTLNFPQIKRVQILIEGEAVETIAGHLSIRQPVPPNLDLIRP
jgi:spore germination protein GerM